MSALVQYYLANGEEIKWTLLDGVHPSMEDVNNITLQYVEKCPNKLPTTLYISVRIYGHFLMKMNSYYSTPIMFCGPVDAAQSMYVNSLAGPLKIKVMPMCSDAKLLLIGDEHDYERYDIDKVFEETVLKDCERE